MKRAIDIHVHREECFLREVQRRIDLGVERVLLPALYDHFTAQGWKRRAIATAFNELVGTGRLRLFFVEGSCLLFPSNGNDSCGDVRCSYCGRSIPVEHYEDHACLRSVSGSPR